MERTTASDGQLRDRALALTITTLILLTPPIITIFDVPLFVFGIPLLHFYCFGVWLAAIAAGCWLAVRMGAKEADFAASNSPKEAGEGR